MTRSLDENVHLMNRARIQLNDYRMENTIQQPTRITEHLTHYDSGDVRASSILCATPLSGQDSPIESSFSQERGWELSQGDAAWMGRVGLCLRDKNWVWPGRGGVTPPSPWEHPIQYIYSSCEKSGDPETYRWQVNGTSPPPQVACKASEL